MKLLKATKPNLIGVTQSFIKALKVKVTFETVESNLTTHPAYPSMASVSDCLTTWGIPHSAYRIPREEYSPEDLLFPFLAHSMQKGGRFILVKGIFNGIVEYSDEVHSKSEMSEADFLALWDGIALHAEPIDSSGEKQYIENRTRYLLRDMRIPLAILLAALILGRFFSLHSYEIGLVSSLLLKSAGLIVSTILLTQSINANNPFIRNLCGLSGNGDCNAILKSDAAKVTPWLNWSEVGFFYFAGSFLSLLINSSTIGILAWLNVLAFPYTIYSISYQYRIKNWCILCCTVQAVLIFEFISDLTFGQLSSAPKITFSVGISIIIGFLIPLLSWAGIKPVLLNAVKFTPLQQQLKKFKYNTDLFRQALTNQPRYAVPEELMPITLGNPGAATAITIVSNPYCGPCAKAHRTIEELLLQNDDIKVKIIFTGGGNTDDDRNKIVHHITSLNYANNIRLMEAALSNWYNQTNKVYESWSKAYPVEINEKVHVVAQRQKEWCELAEINVTPTILINGYKLPEPYRLEDIRYLIT
jgi:uncharacterized membrane protein